MKVDDISFVMESCACSRCPSAVRGAELGAFCHPSGAAKGAMVEDRGCICSSCQVTIAGLAEGGRHCVRPGRGSGREVFR